MTITIKLRVIDGKVDAANSDYNVAFKLAEQVAILANQQGYTDILSFDVLVDKHEPVCESKRINMFLQGLLKKAQKNIDQKDLGEQPGS